MNYKFFFFLGLFANLFSNATWATQEGYFDQLLDPSNPKDQRTFKQRYFINSEFAKGSSAPVFYVICGEGPCSENNLGGAVGHYAKEFGAHIVALEHRYYGKSKPFSDLSSAENLQYLKTDFALSDLARFQTHAETQFKLNGRWVVFGYSYAGNLAAFYRVRYPSHVVGAMASSPPIEAKLDFHEYDLEVASKLPSECLTTAQTVVAEIEKVMQYRNKHRKKRLKKIKALFGLENVDNNEFLLGISYAPAFAVQYGNTHSFCSRIQSENPKERLMNYAAAYQQFVQKSPSPDSNDLTEPKVEHQTWLYQTCTEYGFWLISNSDSKMSAQSSRLDLDYFKQQCKKFFGFDTLPKVDDLNKKFYKPIVSGKVKNLFITNGSNDPWSRVSFQKSGGITLNAQLLP